MRGMAYLDNHTVTRPSSMAVDRWLYAQKERWGSIPALHQGGQELLSYSNRSIEQIKQVLGAHSEDEFIGCGSGAEAINAVLFSHYLSEMRETGKNHVLISSVAEAPLFLSLKRLEKFHCAEKILPMNDSGRITAEAVSEAIKPRTSLVSLSWADGLTGVIHPIEEIAEVCRSKGVALHVDASYMIGKWFFQFKDLEIDYLTWEGALCHAPHGVGGLLVKKGRAFHPFVLGERGCYAGAVAGLASALLENASRFEFLSLETARLKKQLERQIKAECPKAFIWFEEEERLPNTTVFSFPGVESEALLYLLSRQRVYGTIGGGVLPKLSHVLSMSGVPDLLARCSISFSLSYETTEEEIFYAAEKIIENVKQLQQCSAGVWDESLG